MAALTIAAAEGREDLARVLDAIVSTVLTIFADADAGVRYAACEALYNIAKVSSLVLILWLRIMK